MSTALSEVYSLGLSEKTTACRMLAFLRHWSPTPYGSGMEQVASNHSAGSR